MSLNRLCGKSTFPRNEEDKFPITEKDMKKSEPSNRTAVHAPRDLFSISRISFLIAQQLIVFTEIVQITRVIFAIAW